MKRMKIRVTTKKRTFDLLGLTELEGIILRTLVNLGDEYIKKQLDGDDGIWLSEAQDDGLTKEEVYEIGIKLRDDIFKAVDGEG